MSRIVYLVFGTGTPRGGHKMSLRHVEALRRLGFDAVAWIPEGAPAPAWLSHDASVQHGGAFQPDDVLVFPEDVAGALREWGELPQRKVVFCQNHFYAASQGIAALTAAEAAPFDDFMACSRTVANWLARFVRHRAIEIVPAFADERAFASSLKDPAVACSPGKRPMEFAAIRSMVPRLHTGRLPWRWTVVKGMTEAEVAAAMGRSAIFLSLSRLEGLGMTTLEAMASGCLVVGFTGQGGRDYATPGNGFWVEDDDLVGCAEALARAMALVEAEQPVVTHMRAEARETAARFSYKRFLMALEAFWLRRVPKVLPPLTDLPPFSMPPQSGAIHT